MPDQGAKRRAVAELAERGAAVFEPVGGAPGVDLAVRAGDGQCVEVIVKEPASPANGRAFAMRRFRPRPHLFILCMTADGEAWPLPSPVFERFAAGAPGEPEWTLDLDAPASEPLSARLAVYRERWALIADYNAYRSTLGDPLALQVRLAMG